VTMFDLAKWDGYLTEYRVNARKEGATPCDILELLHLAAGREVIQAKAEEIQRDLTEGSGI
jgi:hypothetical protein